MATRYVYVISDLHLGGAAPDNDNGSVGFQMCPPKSRRRLAKFIDYCRTAHSDGETELVINGDFIDFLAEQRIMSDGDDPETQTSFDAFTQDPDKALRKFERVVSTTDDNAPSGERLFEELQAFVGAGHTLTILLGNHDIELGISPVRRALSELLTKGRPARVEFIHDGEAYVRSNVLIEHGNRYDGWNMVSYGRLRAYRSAISRGENPPLTFDAPPGSHLVVNVMNALKKDYRFIDLLKPENEALIPFLAKLEPAVIRHIAEVVSLLKKASRVEPKPGGVPEAETLIASRNSPQTAAADRVAAAYDDPVDETVVELSERLLKQADEEAEEEGVPEVEANISAITDKFKETLHSVRGLYSILHQFGSLPRNRLRRLRKSLITYRELIGSTFDLQAEVPRYQKAAHRLSKGGRIVIFGHTHLAKQIRFPEGGLYLNTGTWCPTIQLPTDYSDPAEPEDQVLARLQDFIIDMQTNQVEKHSRLRMTFAKIVIGNDRGEGGLFEWPEHGNTPQPVK